MKRFAASVLSILCFGVMSNCSSAVEPAPEAEREPVASTQQALCDPQICDEACTNMGTECGRCMPNGGCFCRPFCGGGPGGPGSGGGAICVISWSGWGSWICGDDFRPVPTRPAN